ncbi:MAG: outer membrane protein assembly factor BamE [Magnetovibrio sp.]|nr:outer membrane protein assembly factor BamE [Magnetovibrio sp.]
MWLSAVVLMGAISACSPRIDTRGNAIHMEDVATLEAGVHTRDHVLNKLGSPSNSSAFGNDTWYYISERTETTAFFAPELIERQIVVIKFNEHGVVENIDTFDKESAELVEPTDRKTPTAGNSLGMIEQLLSNLGRFNKK